MNEKPLMKWGGICAFVFAVLWIVFEIFYLISAGIPFQTPTVSEMANMLSGGAYRTFIVLFGISIFFYVVVAYSVYDYLRKTSYGLSRAGFGFVTVVIILWFVYWSLQTAGKTIALSGAYDFETQLSVIMNLLGSLMIPLLWAMVLYAFCWGLAFIKREGNNKIAGFLFLITSLFAFLYYLFSIIGNVLIANIIDLILVIVFIIAHLFVGTILTAESKKG
ncbi:MAG: hypothetical protein A7315_03095 [Candidatus Altiarchaeales archaeon WOR_SM1_79]|nr:MAG: hypothetical protein A7315_03095 [Candidatus Altiarchaeales archaeon WOR_SM1_79]